MKEREVPKPGEFYRHFKGKYYQIITVATHTETRELFVIYQALYGEFGIYARPLTMFMSEVDHEKYPNVLQKYRFECVERPFMTDDRKDQADNSPDKVKREQAECLDERRVSENAFVMDGEVERFLDAKSYKEKLDILMSLRNDITEKQLHDMAITLDVTIEDGDVDEKFMNLVGCLRTLARFEVNR